MQDALDRFVFVDTEAFGLNPTTDFIIELGFCITDTDLSIIDDFSITIWDTPSYDGRLEALRAGSDKFVLEMHNKSGLWVDAQAEGATMEFATTEALDWLNGHGIGRGDPLCGSSVQFDRQMLAAQMPAVEQLFSYRNIDCSTIKELCRRVNPRIYELMEQTTQPMKLHRALPDLRDSVNELSYYFDNFLHTEN